MQELDFGDLGARGPLARPDWTPTRRAGLERLEAFKNATGAAYQRGRNYDLGPEDRSNVSALSPWIRRRAILEQEVLSATLARQSASSAEKFIQEVFWRAYFKGWLEARPSVWRAYQHGLMRDRSQLEGDPDLRRRYEEAIDGRAGIGCFDAWARELVAHGYLHNHARMWFASIWTHTLELPWRLGADFFLRHLIDGDPASNTLSWRWVVGLHTKGKVYQARASNIAKFTDGRFHPGHDLAHEAPPLGEDEHPPAMGFEPGDGPPAMGRVGLLLTEEDAHPESLINGFEPVAATAMTAMSGLSPEPIGARARGFAEGVLDEALARMAAAGAPTSPSRADVTDWGDALVDWSGAKRLDAIVAAAPPVGPVADRLARARRPLKDAGVALQLIRRPYDAAAWPHATKGYFAMKAKIPKLLGKLGLDGRG